MSSIQSAIPSANSRQKSGTNGIAIISLVIAILSASFTGISALSEKTSAVTAVQRWNTELAKVNKDSDDDEKQKWQQLVVYSIIDRAFAKNKLLTGISFDDIKSKYLEAVQQNMSNRLGKEDIQPDVLSRILFDLQKLGMVTTTEDGSYATQRSIPYPHFSRMFAEENAKEGLLNYVSVSAGTHTVAEASQWLQENYKLTPLEANWLINAALAVNTLKIVDNKLWSATNPPPQGPAVPQPPK